MTVNGLINSLDRQLAVIKKDDKLELWQPKLGEWCIMDTSEETPNATSIILKKCGVVS